MDGWMGVLHTSPPLPVPTSPDQQDRTQMQTQNIIPDQTRLRQRGPKSIPNPNLAPARFQPRHRF